MTGSDYSNRDIYLINWRTSVWTSMREKEANCWKFIAVYVPAVLAILGIGFERFPTYILTLASLAVTSWGILTVVDANFWFNRNLKIVSNIERMIAPYVYDERLIPPYYGQPRFQYFMTYRTMIRLFSIVILAVLLWSTYANKSQDGQYRSWALIYLGTLALCVWVFSEDNVRRNNYEEFSYEATGPLNTDDLIPTRKDQIKALRRYDMEGPIAHLVTSSIQMGAIVVFVEVGFPEIKGTLWYTALLSWPFVLLFLCPLISLKPKINNKKVQQFTKNLLTIFRFVFILALNIFATSIGLAILILAAFDH